MQIKFGSFKLKVRKGTAYLTKNDRPVEYDPEVLLKLAKLIHFCKLFSGKKPTLGHAVSFMKMPLKEIKETLAIDDGETLWNYLKISKNSKSAKFIHQIITKFDHLLRSQGVNDGIGIKIRGDGLDARITFEEKVMANYQETSRRRLSRRAARSGAGKMLERDSQGNTAIRLAGQMAIENKHRRAVSGRLNKIGLYREEYLDRKYGGIVYTSRRKGFHILPNKLVKKYKIKVLLAIREKEIIIVFTSGGQQKKLSMSLPGSISLKLLSRLGYMIQKYSYKKLLDARKQGERDDNRKQFLKESIFYSIMFHIGLKLSGGKEHPAVKDNIFKFVNRMIFGNKDKINIMNDSQIKMSRKLLETSAIKKLTELAGYQ